MASNMQEDEGYPDTLEIPANTEEELIQIIETSLHSIVTRINTLSKRAVDFIDEIFEETDRLSFQVTVLEEQVIQKTNAIAYKDQNGGLSLKITNSKIQSTTLQTQQVYSSKQVPVNVGERHDTHALTRPLNRSPFCQDDTGGLEVSPDASHCFKLYKEMTVYKTEEEMGAKPKQKQHKDHPNKKPASVPQTRRKEDDVSVYPVPAAWSEASRSHVDQPDGSSSFSSVPLCEINKLVMRAVGKAISGSHYLPMHESREVKNSLTYVRYGTGKGEESKPQPRIHLKTKVFVSPTAPATAPALPEDWLAALKAPKAETPSSGIDLPTQLPSPVLGTPAVISPAACPPGAPHGAVPITPPKRDFSTPAWEPFPYHELTTDDLFAQAEYQGMTPPLSSAVTSRSVQTRATVTHLSGPMSAVQSSTASATKSSKSSIPSSPRSSLPSSRSYRIPPPSYPVTLLPRSLIPQNSSPLLSMPSCPQTSRSSIPSPRNSRSQPTRTSDTTRSRRSEAQSSRRPEAQSPRRPEAQSSRRPEAQSSRRPEAQSSRRPEAQSPRRPEAQSPRRPEAQSPRRPEAQSSRRPEAQSPRRPEAQSSRRPEAQSSRRPEAQSSRRPEAQSPRRPEAQSSRRPEAQSSRRPEAQSPRRPEAQSPRRPEAQSSRRPEAQSSRRPEAQSPRPSAAQSPRPSAAQSQRSSMAQSTRRLIPPQQNSSSVQSAKSFTLQSSFPFAQSPSCRLRSSGLSVTPSAPAPVNATFKQTPPDVPVIAKVRNAVLAAIRKGILLSNPEDQ